MASSSSGPDAPAETGPPSTASLERLRRVWETLGREDPLWAVLSHPDKRKQRWNADEFLATGVAEIASRLEMLRRHGYPLRRALALDFGCGAGRLSRALAQGFERVLGVDVSASMIDVARTLNADVGGIEFRCNPSARLEGVADASVDFVFSHIVLQHIPADLAAGYVEEFFRVLAPGGAAVFQFVSGTDPSLRGRFFEAAPVSTMNLLRRLAWRRGTVFEMHALPEHRLARLLVRRPWLRLLDATDDASAGPGWVGRRWSVVHEGGSAC
jgi:SAM-dependent methyltransferase